MKRTIVCAAMRHLVSGSIICSPRHFDALCRMTMLEHTEVSWADAEQGFVDQYCVFLSRETSWQIAFDGKQIVRRCGGDTANGGTLYSENLY